MTRRACLLASLLAATTVALRTHADDKKDDKKGDPLAEPKTSIEHQLKLLKEGDVDALRACFVERLRDKITKEAVAGGQKQVEKLTLDDLVNDIAVSEKDGVKTAKIAMKNGRTLTTLVLTDGKWLAGTVWFK
jgi:hypothetical protein